MSELALGTMTFGAETSAREAHAMLDMFVEAGGNFIDTADAYGQGASEETVGAWLKNNPELADRMIVATKARFAMSPDINDRGTSRRHLTRAIDASLRRLQVDTIDLFQLHAWDPRTDVEETLSALDRATAAGKIQYYGLSNFDGWQISKTVMTAVLLGAPPPVSVQPQYSLVAREVEWEILPAARDAHLAILPWSPLGGGLLTGKYVPDASIPSTTRLGRLSTSTTDTGPSGVPPRSWAVLDAVRSASSTSATSTIGVALAWLLHQSGVSSVIVGARNRTQLAENINAVRMVPSEILDSLSIVSTPEASDYPYGPRGREQHNR